MFFLVEHFCTKSLTLSSSDVLPASKPRESWKTNALLLSNNHIARLRAQNPLLTFSINCSHLFVLRTCPHACSIVTFNVESKLRGGKPHAHPSYDHWYIHLHSDIYFTRISSFHVCLLFPVSWREWDIFGSFLSAKDVLETTRNTME